MVEVVRSQEYADWEAGLRDAQGKAKVIIRIQRLAAGNPGDVKPVGAGISELRIDFGPGYRVYSCGAACNSSSCCVVATNPRSARMSSGPR